MTDTIQLYPKSSCPCNSCKKEYKIPTNLPRSNLAINGCKVSPYFDCYYKVSLGENLQPVPEQPYTITELNPQAYTDKLASGFGKVPCQGVDSAGVVNCQDPNFISQDPRLFNSTRPDYLRLDRPPMSGDVKLKNIYNKKYTNYGLGMKPYEMIDDGQIVYYIDSSIKDAFYKPVFSEPAIDQGVLYQDPMGAMKPEFTRKPIMNTENPTITTPIDYPYCLSFIQDSQSQREDIMSYQQRKNNQSKWSARWTFPENK